MKQLPTQDNPESIQTIRPRIKRSPGIENLAKILRSIPAQDLTHAERVEIDRREAGRRSK